MATESGDLGFRGVVNARDIGGRATADGLRVRRGMVFRSAELCTLAEEDHAVIESLGIRTVLDLRSNTERSRRPLVLAADGLVQVIFRSHQNANADFARFRSRPDLTFLDVHRWMIQIYRAMATEQAPSLRLLFGLIDAGRTPILFHCAAGKDRTGVAAALLLFALGVERDEIYADFALTDQDFEANRRRFEASGPPAELLQPRWEPMLRVHPDYLDAFFAAVHAWPGGATGYFRDMIDLDDAGLARVRARLLEPT